MGPDYCRQTCKDELCSCSVLSSLYILPYPSSSLIVPQSIIVLLSIVLDEDWGNLVIYPYIVSFVECCRFAGGLIDCLVCVSDILQFRPVCMALSLNSDG